MGLLDGYHPQDKKIEKVVFKAGIFCISEQNNTGKNKYENSNVI